MHPTRRILSNVVQLGALLGALALALSLGFTADRHTSTPFMGAKANTGTVSHHREGRMNVLTLSEDFKVPDTPDPHWQVVDSKGVVYMLHRLPIKGEKVNRSITLPSYVPDVAKVQIWCSFAETLLGEASFNPPVK
jgi:hypothetical protein